MRINRTYLLKKKNSILDSYTDDKKTLQEDQQKIIEYQKNKILEQQKLIQEYEHQQKLLLEQQEKNLIDKEKILRKEMEQLNKGINDLNEGEMEGGEFPEDGIIETEYNQELNLNHRKNTQNSLSTYKFGNIYEQINPPYYETETYEITDTNQEKKVEEPKHEKINKKKINNNNRERPKTPIGTNKRIKSDKEKEKHDTTDIHNNIKDKKKLTINTGATNPKSGKGRVVTEVGKRPITGKSDAKSRPNIGKKVNSKKTDKKAKSKKEVKKEEQKEEVKEEPPKVEEKKPVIIKPKYIINIPEEIKDKFNLCSIYFILKKNYLNKKQILYIATSNPLLYKTFGNNMKFLLDEKKMI